VCKALSENASTKDSGKRIAQLRLVSAIPLSFANRAAGPALISKAGLFDDSQEIPGEQKIVLAKHTGMDEWIASLTRDQFGALVRNELEPSRRTDIVHSRLAARLAGTTMKVRIPTTTPVEHVEKEVELIRSGRRVHYYLIDDPVRRFMTPMADLRKLERLNVPYTHFTWEEFLDWI
jgi:hypothetical protein